MKKELKPVEEIINDLEFKKNVKSVLSEIVKNREARPEPEEGYHYKRDWYDRMESLNVLNSDFFLNNIKDVWERKSKLSSEFRNVINSVCSTALHRTLKAKPD